MGGDNDVKGFEYSGQLLRSHSWDKKDKGDKLGILSTIKKFCSIINKKLCFLIDDNKEELSFNSCLINYYKTGKNSVGLHSDEYSHLAENNSVITISFGTSRYFTIVNKKDKDEKYNILLDSGDVVIMTGDIQERYKHGVLPCNNKDSRISLTFRSLDNKRKTKIVKIQRKNGKIIQDCDVYIGRAINMGGWNLKQSIWHNPYKTKEYGDKCVELYRKYIEKRLEEEELMTELKELKGKVLGCWCKPNKCHGDVLLEMIDKYC